MNPKIYPILFIIYLCVTWTLQAFKIDKDDKINAFYCGVHTLLTIILLYLCGFFNVFQWPQIVWICLTSIGCVMSLNRHGKSFKNTPGNFFMSLMFILVVYTNGGVFQYLSK